MKIVRFNRGGGKMAKLRVSPSNISNYLFCPYKYFLSKQKPRIPTQKDPRAALGIALHLAIYMLYQILDRPKTLEKRLKAGNSTTYWYTTLQGFINFCAGLITEHLKGDQADPKRVRDCKPIAWPKDATEEEIEELKGRLLASGLWMAKEYYLSHQEKPAPFLREKRLSYPLVQEISSGVELVAVLDQVRKDSQERIWIADLKTGFDPFERVFRETDTCGQKLTKLHIDYQLSAQWLLFEKCMASRYGSPYKVGLYYLKSQNLYADKRTPGQIELLFEIIREIISAWNRNSFPPTGMSANLCRYCDYKEVCPHLRGARPIKPLTIDEIEEDLPTREELEEKLSEELKDLRFKQLRLNLKKRKLTR